MIKIILILLAICLGVFLVVIVLQPNDFRVERTATFSAPPPAAFEQVNDFHKWAAWNPWGKLDPAMKQSYEGAPSGVGAAYSWAGNKNVGQGRMTIFESKPNDLIRVRLEFLKPFKATHLAEFTFKPVGDQTAVTWSMTGKNNFISKALHLFMNMDKMVGDMFEKGLADMKIAAEAAAKGSH